MFGRKNFFHIFELEGPIVKMGRFTREQGQVSLISLAAVRAKDSKAVVRLWKITHTISIRQA